METKIRKRAQIYGITAFLLAIMLGGICYQFGVNPIEPSSTNILLDKFSSYYELKNFIQKNSDSTGHYPYPELWKRFSVDTPSETPTYSENQLSGSDYSTTNIQVEGVDEADIVKTDGKYLYLISENNIFILEAYPPLEAEVLSKITFNHTDLQGLFVKNDRMIILGVENVGSNERYPLGTYMPMKTFLEIYDISNRTDPELMRNFTISGNYFNSRMIDDYIYLVVSQPASLLNDTVILPQIYSENGKNEIEATDIQYFNISDSYFLFTTIIAVNIQDVSEEPTKTPLLLGGASCMYASLENIYITFPAGESTSIYRMHIENGNIEPSAKGNVPGYVINQFSMDEHQRYFRIATTTEHTTRNFEQAPSKNNIYILNMNLSTVGKIEDLASGEKIYSARFMTDRCYLVTFQKIDPLFVIDLSNPTTPVVLGKLKIPGYSDYLHPYDENHIIGVGKHTVEADEGDFAWYQGVKLSLFDVSEVNNPQQVSQYIIGDRGTDSAILSDHKAVLFEKSKNLLVIPVRVAEIDESQYPEEVPDYAYGVPRWQGAYIFNLTLIDGFVLRGNITHLPEGTEIWNTHYWVKRTLYIENILYTISDHKIKMNSLEDLNLIKDVTIP